MPKHFRILCVLLTMLLLSSFLCSCGPKSSFDRQSAIRPGTGTDVRVEDYSVTHVDTNSFGSNAELLLDDAYAVLENLGISSHVEGLYDVDMGIAAGSWSYSVIRIDTDGEGEDADPLSMIVLLDEDGFGTVVGSFRESDLTYADREGVVLNRIEIAGQEVLDSLGLLDGEHFTDMRFNPVKYAGLTFTAASGTMKALYEDCFDAYSNVTFCAWPVVMDSGRYFGDMWMERIDDPEVTCVPDLRTYLLKLFDEPCTDLILSGVDPIFYEEADGALYCAGIGVGGVMDIADISPRFVCEDGDDLWMMVECTRDNWDENWQYMDGYYYEDYMFRFVRTADGWKCHTFIDIPFGFI